MPSGYRLNGNDLYDVYGITVESVRGLYTPPKRKGDAYYSWPDENGEEAYDNVEDYRFEGRDVFIHCRLAATKVMFHMKMTAFLSMLKTPGVFAFRVPYNDTQYDLVYIEGSEPRFLTKWNAETIYVQFYIKFRECNP